MSCQVKQCSHHGLKRGAASLVKYSQGSTSNSSLPMLWNSISRPLNWHVSFTLLPCKGPASHQ